MSSRHTMYDKMRLPARMRSTTEAASDNGDEMEVKYQKGLRGDLTFTLTATFRLSDEEITELLDG